MFPIIQALMMAQQMKKNQGGGAKGDKAQTALGLGSLLSGWQQPPADKSVVNFAEDPTGQKIFDQYQKQKPLTY
jgi:hypothetical protein